ncbi:TetR/AcrR family transcriptional regulator [Ferrovibrio terrae]|uniref:TetR/AcrR family transcriptional regulator n=2 Tax=Ferrovibrio terrae TaxID=2594003 RepID=A0A516H5D9_9PROT|nr:TetR/AcrR family transcriptional regulator [Ferrovibrio terrae]
MNKMSPKRGRPVDPAKRAAILDTARELFFEHGYGVGLETIAARAGVSRQTIYNLFESKDDLFAAIVQDTSGPITAALAELTPDATPRDVLTALGVSFLTKILSDRAVQFQRLLIGSAASFPTLGPTFYANGPGRGLARLAAYLDRETSAKRLAVSDPVLAAEQFFGMLMGHRSMRRTLRIDGEMPAEEIRRRVDAAVSAFLRAYSP